MKKLVLAICIIAFAGVSATAQKYFTRDGKIGFYSEAPMEKIEAHNNTVTAIVDAESGKMEFAVLIKAFQFEKALMQEHFNENYMESDKFPKATFKGQIGNMDDIQLGKDGEYTADVSGELTIHGVANAVETTGTFTVADGKVSAVSSFEIKVADYKIEIPAVVRDNIAKTVRIDVNLNLQELKSKS